MKFLLDENFPRSAADLIDECGHEAVRFDDVCNSGDDDDAVFAAAQRIDATVLTSDRDFYHTIPLLHPVHAGIVVVALCADGATVNMLSCCPGENTATEARFVWHSDSDSCTFWYANGIPPKPLSPAW